MLPSIIVYFLLISLACLTLGALCDYVYIAGRNHGELSQVLFNNASFQQDVSPESYVYPHHCSAVACKAAVFRRTNHTYALVPSGQRATLCEMGGREAQPSCSLLAEEQSVEDPFMVGPKIKDYLFATSVGTSTPYLVSVSERDVYVGVLNDDLSTVKNSVPNDLSLERLEDLSITTLWESPSGHKAVLALRSPTYLLLFHLSNDSAATLSTLGNREELKWSTGLSVGHNCPSISQLIPDVARNIILLVCAGGRHFVQVECRESEFRRCAVSNELTDASSLLQTTPLTVLHKSKPQTVTFFITKDRNHAIQAEISNSLGTFTGLTYVTLYEGPLREITTFCTPHGSFGQQKVTFFTAIEGNKRYMYQIEIRGEQPKLIKLESSLCLSCTILHCTEETLLVGDTVNNSTFTYSIAKNVRQSTPMSAESAPILVHTFEAPTAPTSPTGNHKVPTSEPKQIGETYDPGVAAGVTIAMVIILLAIVLVMIAVVVKAMAKKGKKRRHSVISQESDTRTTQVDSSIGDSISTHSSDSDQKPNRNKGKQLSNQEDEHPPRSNEDQQVSNSDDENEQPFNESKQIQENYFRQSSAESAQSSYSTSTGRTPSITDSELSESTTSDRNNDIPFPEPESQHQLHAFPINFGDGPAHNMSSELVM